MEFCTATCSLLYPPLLYKNPQNPSTLISSWILLGAIEVLCSLLEYMATRVQDVHRSLSHLEKDAPEICPFIICLKLARL